jgi:hypothetical protein
VTCWPLCVAACTAVQAAKGTLRPPCLRWLGSALRAAPLRSASGFAGGFAHAPQKHAGHRKACRLRRRRQPPPPPPAALCTQCPRLASGFDGGASQIQSSPRCGRLAASCGLTSPPQRCCAAAREEIRNAKLHTAGIGRGLYGALLGVAFGDF